MDLPADPRADPRADPSSAGAGPDGALLLHGFTSAPSTMAPVADRLAASGVTVETPRLPGHGTCWQDLADTPPEALLQAARDAWDELSSRCGEVGVVGLSLGGALALHVAAHRPVAGVAVINPALRLHCGQGLAARLLCRMRPTIGSIAGDIARPGVTEEAYARTPLRGVAAVDRVAAQVRAELGDVAAEVLLLRSRQDGVLPHAAADTLVAGLAPEQLTRIMLRRSRHVATLDHDAERVAAATEEFLAQAARRRRTDRGRRMDRDPRMDRERAEAEDR